MSPRLLSAIVPAPAGFSPCGLTKRVLLAGPLVLLCHSVEEVLAAVPDGRERIEGVLVTAQGPSAPARLGPLLWTFGYPLEALAGLGAVLPVTLEAVESAVSYRERLSESSRSAERVRRELRVTREDYNRISGKLLEDLEHSKASAAENARLFTEAQAALRARDEFLSVASHELKTPLTPLTLQIQGIRRRLESEGDEKLKRLVGRADKQLARLARLVETLLDVSRVSLGRLPLRPEPTDLVELVRGVLEQFQVEIERSGCQVSLVGEPSVRGEWDPLRLEQVVVNLVSNALKFAAHKPIQIRVERPAVDRARLVVADRGIGIAPEDQPRLFGRFERAAPPTQFGGLGLGLYISRQIVEAHGGSISLESRPGAGSTVVVELPVKRAGPAG